MTVLYRKRKKKAQEMCEENNGKIWKDKKT